MNPMRMNPAPIPIRTQAKKSSRRIPRPEADKDPPDESRPAVGVASSWVSSRSYCVHRTPPRRSTSQENVQHDLGCGR